MYTKLTGRGILMMTGLSAFLLQTCGPLLTSFTWAELYANRSGREVVLVWGRPEDGIYNSYTLDPGTQLNKGEFTYNGDDPVSRILRYFERNPLRTISLYVDKDSLVKTWRGPAGYYGDSIHSPFNYHSWVAKSVKDTLSTGIRGKVTFTITEEDLK